MAAMKASLPHGFQPLRYSSQLLIECLAFKAGPLLNESVTYSYVICRTVFGSVNREYPPHNGKIRKAPVNKTPKKTPKTEDKDFSRDRRRKHHHYLVTVSYADGERFGRVYTDKDKAMRFAERQRRSPIVKSARVSQVS